MSIPITRFDVLFEWGRGGGGSVWNLSSDVHYFWGNMMSVNHGKIQVEIGQGSFFGNPRGKIPKNGFPCRCLPPNVGLKRGSDDTITDCEIYFARSALSKSYEQS